MTENSHHYSQLQCRIILRNIKHNFESFDINEMTSLQKTGSTIFGSYSDSYGHCCPPVFDPYTLLALIGGIALATYFLGIVIITEIMMMGVRFKRQAGYFGL